MPCTRVEIRMAPSATLHEPHRRPCRQDHATLGGQARPTSVAWSGRQGRRWGACSVADGAIRISTRVQGMPAWVLDYVLLHELAHLLSGCLLYTSDAADEEDSVDL